MVYTATGVTTFEDLMTLKRMELSELKGNLRYNSGY